MPQKFIDSKVRIYRGTRLPNQRLIVTVNGTILDPRCDLRNHSPTGFECGYGGSGPAQLALALLADHLGNDHEAVGLYQDFKRAVVVNLPESGWTLTGTQIAEAVATLRSPASRGASILSNHHHEENEYHETE